MVGYGFILIPLYIQPQSAATWQPLVDAARNHSQAQFTAVINPDNGPGAGSCPTPIYADAIASLNAVPNISLLGYVHTANRYTCDTICTCSAPLQILERNVTTYQDWPTSNCSGSATAKPDIHVDGIFMDEAPSNSSCLAYMQNATAFAKKTMTRGNTILFNAGAAVDSKYFGVADYINVFENSEAAYDSAIIGSLDYNGVYSRQSTLLMYDYTTASSTLSRDVSTILSFVQDSFAGLYISDLGVYTQFPTIWGTFVTDVAKVVASNMAGSK